jgi:hypothetical protein
LSVGMIAEMSMSVEQRLAFSQILDFLRYYLTI